MDKNKFETIFPPLCTPVTRLSHSVAGNTVYMKRDDLLPFSFGGNKVRFAKAYLTDMEKQKKNAVILYGGDHSNLCRIMAAACHILDIPCVRVVNLDDGEEKTPLGMLTCPLLLKDFPCRRDTIPDAVREAMAYLSEMGYDPYYVYGDPLGKGNELPPMVAAGDIFAEVCEEERESGLRFDRIFLADSTDTTHAGILAKCIETGDERPVIGMTVSRGKERAGEVIREKLSLWAEHEGRKLTDSDLKRILVSEDGRGGGYGHADDDICRRIIEFYHAEGVALDPYYTGKAFFGMEKYLLEHGIKGETILFYHSGGTPLFWELVAERNRGGSWKTKV